MRIVVVSGFYSEGMGYTENCLPRSLARLGHEVHVVSSDLNVYGNTADYDRTYRSFLGPAKQPAGTTASDGYMVHRLRSRLVSGYVHLTGLAAKIRELAPDVVHSTEIASLQTFVLAAAKPFIGFELFTETHQHMSVVKPFLKTSGGPTPQRIAYWLTRTAPTFLASLPVQKCYAISPDCAEVAMRFYGVPAGKIKMQSLGTDTELFRPPQAPQDLELRARMRSELGYTDDDVVCVYTGRFSNDKNPLLLASAIDTLVGQGRRFHGLFVGDGVQRAQIEACRNTRIVPFMTHQRLSEFYRMCDVAIWPTQESMSMLDAASSGLPLIVSRNMGEQDRIDGNGKVYQENSVADLASVLDTFGIQAERQRYGSVGRKKMVDRFSWLAVARSMEADYMAACAH